MSKDRKDGGNKNGTEKEGKGIVDLKYFEEELQKEQSNLEEEENLDRKKRYTTSVSDIHRDMIKECSWKTRNTVKSLLEGLIIELYVRLGLKNFRQDGRGEWVRKNDNEY